MSEERYSRTRRMLIICLGYYTYLTQEPEYILERPVRRAVHIIAFTPSECRINFRFCQPDLSRLFTALHFPEWIIFDNRGKMRGEEVFLRGLYELVTGENQHRSSTHIFGREGTTQSRAFKAFINHIYDNFQHLLRDNLSWWKRNRFFRLSAEAIQNKVGNVEVDIGNCSVAHFIDCNCLETSVVGGGPAEAGPDAPRWDDTIQRAFYNGWKSVHGLKHQTVNNAYGFTIDICGPTSLRRNDLQVLRDSDINNRMAALQVEDLFQFIIFGDSAYRRQSHIMSYLKDEDEIENFRRWNSAN